MLEAPDYLLMKVHHLFAFCIICTPAQQRITKLLRLTVFNLKFAHITERLVTFGEGLMHMEISNCSSVISSLCLISDY